MKPVITAEDVPLEGALRIARIDKIGAIERRYSTKGNS
jgi:hypothetical protein